MYGDDRERETERETERFRCLEIDLAHRQAWCFADYLVREEGERDLEVWYIALAHRQAWCFVDYLVREGRRERERKSNLKIW